MSTKTLETIVFGAGASGLMAANILGDRCLVLEANERAAKKMLVSGGGRCNFTNRAISSKNYCDNGFVTDALSSFGHKECLEFVHGLGVGFEERDSGQYFCKNSAGELVSALLDGCRKRVLLNAKVEAVEYKNGFFEILSSNGEYKSKNLLVTTGGISYAQLGASDAGYKIAKLFGHEIVIPKPALVGFTLQPQELWLTKISGVSLDVSICVAGRTFRGGMVCAHKGVSGPTVLNASLYWEKGHMSIDFLPHISSLQSVLVGKKQISSVLNLPKSFTKAYLASVNLQDLPCEKLSSEQKEMIAKLKEYRFAPSGTFGFSKAEITKGGVSCEEIDSRTMQSRLQKGLYFAGEVLDVNGELGGYNFAWAFASARLAANSIL